MEQHIKQIDPAILAEQKAYKASKESFRAAIKALVEWQKTVKPQRKETIPNRSMEPAMAASTHRLNRWELRHLHIAYAIFHGKPLPEKYWKWDTAKRDIFRLGPKTDEALLRPNVSPDFRLIEKLLKTHVQKAQVIYPGS